MKLQRKQTNILKLVRRRVVAQVRRNRSPKKLIRTTSSKKLTRTRLFTQSPMLLFDSDSTSLLMQDKTSSFSPVQTGPVRFAATQTSRVNLVRNPRFAANTSGWAAVSFGSINRVVDDRFQYGTAAEIASSSSTTGATMSTTLSTSVVERLSGGTYTVSFDAVLVSGTSAWSIWRSHRNASGTLRSEIDSPFTVTNTVTRFSLTFAPSAGSYSTIFRFTTQSGVGIIRISNVMFEQGSHSNDPYFEGNWYDPVTGYATSANAGASAEYVANYIVGIGTNLVPNPSFETNTTSWAAVNGATISRDTLTALYGSASLLVLGSADGQGVTTSGITVGIGNTYTASIYVKGVGTYTVELQERNSGTYLAGTVSPTQTANNDVWQRVVVSRTFNQAGVNQAQISIVQKNAGSLSIYLDGAQLELKGHVTPYMDGSLGTGHTWLSTAHASLTNRTATVLRAPVTNRLDTTKGSISVWYYVNYDHSDTPYIFTITDAATTTAAALMAIQPDRSLRLTWYNGTQLGNAISAVNVATSGVWHHLYVEWNGNSIGFSQDNGAMVTGTRLPPYTIDMTNSTFNLGYYRPTSNGHLDGLISQWYVFDRPLTSDERTMLYQSRLNSTPFRMAKGVTRVRGA